MIKGDIMFKVYNSGLSIHFELFQFSDIFSDNTSSSTYTIEMKLHTWIVVLQRVKIFGRVGSGQKICASRVFSGRVGCYIILEIKLDFAFYFQILPLSVLLFTLSLNL